MDNIENIVSDIKDDLDFLAKLFENDDSERLIFDAFCRLEYNFGLIDAYSNCIECFIDDYNELLNKYIIAKRFYRNLILPN